MEAFLTGFVYIAGGTAGAAAVWYGVQGLKGVVTRTRGNRREERSVRSRTEAKEQRLKRWKVANDRADMLLKRDERVEQLVQELGNRNGDKHQRGKLQKKLRELVKDGDVRHVLYARTR